MNAQRFLSPPEAQSSPVDFASGHHRLSGRLHLPAGLPTAVAVLSGATGVTQAYYQSFAAWLARDRGVACLTYDYRDYGASAQGPLRLSRATMADWGLHDQAAAIAYVRQTVPGVPIWLIGHSLGGLLVRFLPDLTGVERIFAVASGPVHWTNHPWGFRLQALAFWFGHAPLIVRALGYLPGRALGLGADLPAGVYWQWRRWCTRRGFLADDIGASLPRPAVPVHARVTFAAMSDDPVVPPAGVWRLMADYPVAPKRQVVIRPSAFRLRKIGHIGAFARANAVIWPALMQDFSPPGAGVRL